MGKVYDKVLKVTIKYVGIIIMFLIVFTINSKCLANNDNLMTNDFELTSRSEVNGELLYGIYIKIGEEYKTLVIKATDFNLPSNLYNYKDDIRMRITYSPEDYRVYACKVINYKTGEILEDLSEENLNKLFNIEYGKDITDKEWVDKIKLSQLKENEFYKYTANDTLQFPEIENDLEKNCIIYIKQKDDANYDREINMGKKISGNGVSMSFNEYNSGESFCIMYKTLGNSELINLINKDEIIYLSKYKDGDKLEYQFEKYIYNDTEKDITIHCKDEAFGIEDSKSTIIPKGEIWGYDWMIDFASISYSKDTNDNENQNSKPEEENNKNENITTEQTKEDNTISPSKLPQTGVNYSILFIIIGFIICILIIGLKISKYKDIK